MSVTLPQTKNYKVPDLQALIGLITSDAYAMQQKIDGRRLMVMKSEHGLVGYNKLYEAIDMPVWLYDSLEVLPEHPWVFDGELTKSQYHIFDLADAPGNRADRSFDERILMLKALLGSIDTPKITSVPTWFSPRDKLTEMIKLKLEGAEGVVFRPRKSSSFFTGSLYKYKFYATVDCVVTQKMVEGKRAVEMGVFRNSELVPIGKCKVEYHIQERMTADQVIEVRYRKLSDAGRLIEPVFVRTRSDKRAYQCGWDQLTPNNVSRDMESGQVMAALNITREEATTLLEKVL